MPHLHRRRFLQLSAWSSAFLGLSAGKAYSYDQIDERIAQITTDRPQKGKNVMGLKAAPMEQVRVAFIGLGMRGPGHAKQVANLAPKAKITAICDIRAEKTKATEKTLKEMGQSPATYSGTAEVWKEMLQRDDIDIVIISTPWDDHVPMATYAMEQGKHVAVEVPAAMTLEECWSLVDTAEATQRNCMMMENVCYGDEELWLLHMASKGVLGELTYAECAYIHDLRELMFSQDGYYDQWRIRHHIKQDGNLYPTHGLGPVAQYMGISRGDRFDRLVSMSSLEAGLTAHSKTVESDNEFHNRSDFKHGDVNQTLIKTAKGRSILVKHDVVTPRPYNRINALAGTEGYHEGYPSRLSLKSEGGHRWLAEEKYNEMRKQYKHPIWDELKEEIAKNGGHGGMDFVQLYRLIDCLHQGKALDMDVYDAADWSVVIPLSKLSAELGSIPIPFPDFTRGMWKKERILGMMENV
ncbi:MAG: Gfo/Idh/MocA family oxidoreductase [Bacteroidota bacterium]